MNVIVSSKYKGDPIKNEEARVLTTLNIDFSTTHGQLTPHSGRIWPKIKLIRDFMVVLLTCKNEEDPIKNEGVRVLTTLNIDFSTTQGQLTLQSRVESG